MAMVGSKDVAASTKATEVTEFISGEFSALDVVNVSGGFKQRNVTAYTFIAVTFQYFAPGISPDLFWLSMPGHNPYLTRPRRAMPRPT